MYDVDSSTANGAAVPAHVCEPVRDESLVNRAFEARRRDRMSHHINIIAANDGTQ